MPSEIQKKMDELIDVRDADWYREEMERLTTGSVIRTYRENRGWSQAELARRAKLAGGRRYVYAIESERRGLGIRAARPARRSARYPGGQDYRSQERLVDTEAEVFSGVVLNTVETFTLRVNLR